MTRSPFTEPLPVVVVLCQRGAVHLVTNPDDAHCQLCHNQRQIRIWNPELTDQLSYELATPGTHIRTVPCPACRPSDPWEATS